MSERTERLLTWALAGGLFLYVLFRAILVPITYDEATTFFRYINLGHYWPGDGLWDANNHILNSLLSIWSFRLFGVGEIWLRLPSVLASILYLGAAINLSSLISNKRLKWLLLLALCCNHFVLEFFAVSRGYGLSMALLLLCVLFLYKWSSSTSILELLIALTAMQLATLANLSLLTVNMLVIGWVIVWLLLKHRTKLIPSFLMLGVSGWCVKWFIELSFEYKERGLLYYGSGSGIWESTLNSLAEFGFPGVEAVFPHVAVGIVLVLMAVTMMNVLKNGLEERSLFSYLFLGALLAVVSMHHFMGVNYPEDRVAMHFLVLAPVALVCLIDKLFASNIGQKASTTIMISSLLLLVFPINMALSANLTHVKLWKEDACARSFYETILRESEKSGTMPTIAGYRLRDLPLYYYGFKNNYPITVLQDIAYRGDEADYQYALLSEEGLWDRYEKIGFNKAAGLHLLKRKKAQPQILWAERTTGPHASNNGPYTVFFESDIDSMAGKDLLWDIELEMPRIDEPFLAWITTDIATSENENLMLETIVLDWLKPAWQEGGPMRQKILIPNIPEEATHIKLYFWNIEQKPIALGEARVKLIELAQDKPTN